MPLISLDRDPSLVTFVVCGPAVPVRHVKA